MPVEIGKNLLHFFKIKSRLVPKVFLYPVNVIVLITKIFE